MLKFTKGHMLLGKQKVRLYKHGIGNENVNTNSLQKPNLYGSRYALGSSSLKKLTYFICGRNDDNFYCPFKKANSLNPK